MPVLTPLPAEDVLGNLYMQFGLPLWPYRRERAISPHFPYPTAL